MSEIMRPLSFAALMEQALGEYEKTSSVFGIREQRFYRNRSGVRMTRYGASIDSPIGPAAGPHSQLAENILAAFLAGSRFIELKTVQTMDGDELRACVARPCINATDECYNVEWSTELTVQQALEEYVKGWLAVHVLGTEFDLGTNVVFNMSVGYSLEGIQSKKIDDYLEGMRDASSTAVWAECTEWLQANLSRFSNFDASGLAAIPTQVSSSVTLSTLHGCPANEIERIAHYLLTVKKLHTCIKCNPTLLGYREARRILDEMGYGYIAFDDHHFVEDLQFDDAVAMIGRLRVEADALDLDFGVKITNTFPVDIKRNELPGEEMYMSGRALFPLSLNVANRLSRAFDGRLQISYSGGVDALNIERLLKTGIRPITMATTLLKPGGYERIPQLATLAEGALDPAQSKLDVALLDSLAAGVVSFARHRKDYRETDSHKSDVALPLFDCADAPCSATGCPINQQIPAYLEQVACGEYERAFAIIANDNVLPSVTATICDHQCQTRCTRLDYDDPLQIRSAKKAASLAAQQAYTKALTRPPALRSTAKVLVVGAGPAGLAAASYLRRNGVDVTVHEARANPLGIVSHIIPAFRISEPELALDVELARAYGVDFEFNVPADYDLAALKSQYDYIILATGAWKEGRSDIPLDGVKVIDALDFLARSRASGLKLELGERVAVIGGGDVAMDCARAAARNEGVREATIVYRRTRDFMPAQREEIELALTDGVRIVELHAPHSFEDGALICDIMELGETDASGRRSVRACGRTAKLGFDTIISAVGAGVDSSLFAKNGLALDERGYALLSDNCEGSLPGIYLAGDCKAGPKTVVKAMADAKTIATDILAKLGLGNDFRVFEPKACRDELLEKKGVLIAAEPNCGHASHDAVRCLACGQVCEVCVDVCPNRANVSIEIGEESGTDPAHLTQRHQILHLDGLCNECGNCGVFCPTAGNPYLDKFTLFMCEEDFAESANRGFLPLGDKRYRIRLEDGGIIESSLDDGLVPATAAALMRSAGERYSYLLRPDAACFDPSIGADARIGTRG